MTHLFRVGGTVPDVNNLPDIIAGKGLQDGDQVQVEVKRENNHFLWELVTQTRPEVENLLKRMRDNGATIISYVLNPVGGSNIGTGFGYELVTPSLS